MSLGSAADLASMLQDAGVRVVFNGVDSYGILEHGSELQASEQGGMVQARVTTLLIATSAFTNLRVGGRITAAGAPYRIDPPIEPQDDGELTLLHLARQT